MPATHRSADQPQPPIRIDSSSGLVAAVPYLCGFMPRESMVVVFTASCTDCVGLTLRLDLFDDSDADAVAAVVRGIAQAVARALEHGVDLAQAHVLVFTEHAPELPHLALVGALLSALEDSRIEPGDALAVGDERMWSYRCAPPCCPGRGHALARHAALKAQFDLTVAGVGYLPNRESLRASLLPADGTGLSRVALRRAVREREEASDPPAAGERWRRAAEDAMVATFSRDEPDHEILRQDGPRWAAALADSRVREPLLYRLVIGVPAPRRREVLAAARAWLIELVALVPGRWCAPVAATLAALVWQQGDGAFAAIAAEHALSADPDNTLAELVYRGAGSGVPPMIWRDVFGAFSLAELRAALPAGSLSPAAG